MAIMEDELPVLTIGEGLLPHTAKGDILGLDQDLLEIIVATEMFFHLDDPFSSS